MKSQDLQKPTLFRIVRGGCVTLIRDSFHVSQPALPRQIGKYRLHTDVRKERGYRYSFGLGIYTYKKKKYFIKHWEGTVKDMCYYNLVNEYFLGKILAEKLASLKENHILAPQVIEYVRTSQSFSIIYEYIDGKILLSYPESIRSKVLLQSIEVLKTVSSLLTPAEARFFTKRSPIFYFISFLPLSLFVLMMNIRYTPTIVKSFIRGVAIIPSISKIQYHIAHRDLDATNIIMAGKDAYLTDFESMVLTFPAYDLVWLALSPDIKKLPNDLAKQMRKKENMFLRIYILFHLALSANAIPTLRTMYVEKLTRYE